MQHVFPQRSNHQCEPSKLMAQITDQEERCFSSSRVPAARRSFDDAINSLQEPTTNN